jgi:hypothetical protein
VRGRATKEQEALLKPAQSSASTTAFVGTWRSGKFAYTFNRDGTYVHVGAMGGSAMRTQISEEETYAVSADVLTDTNSERCDD